jgi:hypothetical protein
MLAQPFPGDVNDANGEGARLGGARDSARVEEVAVAIRTEHRDPRMIGSWYGIYRLLMEARTWC